MLRRLITMTVLVMGCAPARARNDSAPGGETLRVCIENATIGYGQAHADANGVRYFISGGETVCKEVGVTRAAIMLRARTTSGGIGGPLSFAASVDPARDRCWHWKLANTPDSRRARPCEEVPGSPGNAPASTGTGS